MTPFLQQRRAGVVLHPTSLPGPGPCGTLGREAFRFMDWLAAAGFTVWQMLPVSPTSGSLSPYQTRSAFAGNIRLLGVDSGLAEPVFALPGREGDAGGFDEEALHRLWCDFQATADSALRTDFLAYWRAQRAWLLPWTLFSLASELHGDGWWLWPEGLRHRQPAALGRLMAADPDRLREHAFRQFLFDRQWQALRHHAAARGILLCGDVPIYVDINSADVWWHRRLFRVDADGQPAAVAGVPPDYFAAGGQVWGNPLYDWPRMQADGFAWWVARFGNELRRFDLLRFDHFRGLEAYWEVPAGAQDARGGRWCPGPGAALLDALRSSLGELPLIVEDLGVITDEVRALRDRAGLPGMLVLQFAFDGSPDNPYLPAHHRERAVVYTGTHDNDTLRGWWQALPPDTQSHIQQVMGVSAEQMPNALLTAAWQSPARLAIAPFQDLLELGGEARMNRPGTTDGNWCWRFDWAQVPAELASRCRHSLLQAGRIPAGPDAVVPPAVMR